MNIKATTYQASYDATKQMLQEAIRLGNRKNAELAAYELSFIQRKATELGIELRVGGVFA